MTQETETIEVQIPFAGFYESIHSYAIDEAFNSVIWDHDDEPIEELQDELWRVSDTSPYETYAKAYVEAFIDYFAREFDIDIDMEYAGMSSPREYNFSTDRIFARMPVEQLRTIREEVSDEVFADHVKDNYTSCDGFISFYDNDIDNWPKDVADYDHNEAYTLIYAWLLDKFAPPRDLEWQVFENSDLSEAARNAVWETASDELVALAKRAQAIRDRAEAKETAERRMLCLPGIK